MSIKILDHPVLHHKLTNIRKKTTGSKEFKESINEISRLMAYEVLKNVKTKEIEIETPITFTKGLEIDQQINLFPILRAGLSMVNGFEGIVPYSRIGHIGLYRNEKTLEPVQYLFKVPKGSTENTLNIVLDPMIATGGSMIKAIDRMKAEGFSNIVVASLVASKQGIEKVMKAHPDLIIYILSVDSTLLENGYISPGLGDVGDRVFGTK